MDCIILLGWFFERYSLAVLIVTEDKKTFELSLRMPVGETVFFPWMRW